MDTINSTGNHLKARQHHMLQARQDAQYPGDDTLLFWTDEAII